MTTEQRIKEATKTQRHKIYLELYNDYRNNFLTVTRFAEYYGLDEESAIKVINIGKLLIERAA